MQNCIEITVELRVERKLVKRSILEVLVKHLKSISMPTVILMKA